MPLRAALSHKLAGPLRCALLHRLVILTTTDRELEATSTASKFPVNFSISVQSVVNTTSLLLVQNDLQHLAAILLGS